MQDNFEMMVDAAALWEAAIEFDALTGLGDCVGTADFREVIVGMVPRVQRAWRIARAWGYDDPFDWEFCPAYLRACSWRRFGRSHFTIDEPGADWAIRLGVERR